jgi:hypothetical protein
MIDVAVLDKEAVAHWRATRDMPSETPNMAQRALVHFDGITRFVLPLCTAVRGHAVTNCTYVVDASALSLRQVWDLRDFARDISWLVATCYPETIHRAYVSSPDF